VGPSTHHSPFEVVPFVVLHRYTASPYSPIHVPTRPQVLGRRVESHRGPNAFRSGPPLVLRSGIYSRTPSGYRRFRLIHRLLEPFWQDVGWRRRRMAVRGGLSREGAGPL